MNNDNQIQLTVITVNYNNIHGLEKTISSVVNQKFTNFEYVIIDGGSSDCSKQIIEKYADKIQYWVSETDQGIYHAMNKAISVANGEYLLFLNSGDVFVSDMVLSKIYLEFGSADVIYGNIEKTKPHYRRIIKYSPTLTLYDFYKVEPGLHHQASFIRRALFQKYGLYDLSINVIADWEFFFRSIIINKASTKYSDITISIVEGTGLSNSIAVGTALRISANQLKMDILTKYFPEYILTDYRKMEDTFAYRSLLRRFFDRLSYFRLKK